jgi:hypothetical protein
VVDTVKRLDAPIMVLEEMELAEVSHVQTVHIDPCSAEVGGKGVGEPTVKLSGICNWVVKGLVSGN